MCAATLAALVWCAGASAHGGEPSGFRSTVTEVVPAVAGLTVEVLDGDDRLRIRNETSKELIVLGYEGEPYLAFRSGHVYRNIRSPATYLNDDRYATVAVPNSANATALAEWAEVASGEEFEWHDHRIHWMSPELPPQVRGAEDRQHRLFDWTVPVVLDERAVRISGSLDYVPPRQGVPIALVVPLVLSVVGAVVLTHRAVRRRRQPGPT